MTVLSIHRPSAPFADARSRLSSRVHRATDSMESNRSQTALMVASSSAGLVAVLLCGAGFALIR